jgi:Pyruvate/2-oxoacid:ferredoxin oxidoreductase delta subunit
VIYCFSGTGNSQWVADKLKGCLPSLEEDGEGIFGMVFPVYGWGIPKVVNEYIEAHREEIKSAQYVWVVMTCGDDIGYADKVLSKAIGRNPDLVVSVRMPNTYVCLPGFDVDKYEVATTKVQETLKRIPDIAESIKNRETKTDVVRGKMAWMKTYVLRPPFNRFLVTDKYFHTNKRCIRCKRCVRGCPMGNITTDDTGKIVWKHEHCTGCLRCYHRCPNLAVQFGKFTKNKGQKIHDFD